MRHPLFTEAFYGKKASFQGTGQQPNHIELSASSEQVEVEQAWLVFGPLQQQQLMEVLKAFRELSVNKWSALANEQPTRFTSKKQAASITEFNLNMSLFKTLLFSSLSPENINKHRLYVGNRIYVLLKELLILLQEDSLSLNKATDLIQQISEEMTVCPEGVVTHLEGVIRELQEPVLNPIEFILNKKEQLIEQIIAEYVKKKTAHEDSNIHFVNALFHSLAEEFGLTERPYESHVKKESLQNHYQLCTDFVQDKMTPMLLVSHIATACLNEITPIIMRYKSMTHTIPADKFKDFSTDFTQALAPYPCFNFNTFCLDNSAVSKPVSIRMNCLNDRFLESKLALILMTEGVLQKHEFELLYYTAEKSLYTLANHWFFLKTEQGFATLDLPSLIALDPLKIEQPGTTIKQTSDKLAPLITLLLSQATPETARECPIRYIYTVEHLIALSALLKDSIAKDYFLINSKSLIKETSFLFKDYKIYYEFIINFPMTAWVLKEQISLQNNQINDNQQHLLKFLYVFMLSRKKVDLECLNLSDDLPLSISPQDFINIALLGEADVVKKILPKLIGINETDENGLTTLMLASRCTLEDYLSNYCNGWRKSVLVSAIAISNNSEKNLTSVVQALLLHPGIAINQLSQPKQKVAQLPSSGSERAVPKASAAAGESALMMAVKAGQFATAVALLTRDDLKVQACDSRGKTALSYVKDYATSHPREAGGSIASCRAMLEILEQLEQEEERTMLDKYRPPSTPVKRSEPVRSTSNKPAAKRSRTSREQDFNCTVLEGHSPDPAAAATQAIAVGMGNLEASHKVIEDHRVPVMHASWIGLPSNG